MGVTDGGWISVDEREPAERQDVVLVGLNHFTGEQYIAAARFECGEFVDTDEELAWANVTHWMPLPPMPEHYKGTQ